MVMLKTCVILFFIRITYTNGCTISYNATNDKNSPIFINNSTRRFNLVIPKDGNIRIDTEESILLLCSDPRNFIIQTNSNFTTLKCGNNKKFYLNSHIVDIDEFRCKKSISGEIYQTHRKCYYDGKTINIGYKLRNKWISLIETCYNKNLGLTYYSQHKVYGTEISFASKGQGRPSFDDAGLGSIPASVVYKKPYQKSTFSKILGSSKLAENYIKNSSYLARGHLSPQADFLLGTWQSTTYFYLNICPQWQSINNGNWKKLEIMVRQTASEKRKTYTVTTGTHRVLQLADVNNQLQEIYLSSGKIPVPKYMWKVISDEKTRSAIAIVVLNNPFLDRVDRKDQVCTSICEDVGWYAPQWSSADRGYIQCCTLNDLENRGFPFHPSLMINSNVLTGINFR